MEGKQEFDAVRIYHLIDIIGGFRSIIGIIQRLNLECVMSIADSKTAGGIKIVTSQRDTMHFRKAPRGCSAG